MKKLKKMLMVTAVELVAAQKLLREKKKQSHKASTKLAKINAKRAINRWKRQKKNIEKHRELLKAPKLEK